jgi:preprotein translocase subunit SecG
MGFLSVLLLVIFAIASLLLIGVVLIQDEQGEGLGGLFGGGGSASFGSRSGNILTRFTSILGAVFLSSAFILAWINRTPETGDLLGAARRGTAVESTVNEWWVVDDAENREDAEAAETSETPAAESSSDESDSSE